jgi:hypothetical protein
METMAQYNPDILQTFADDLYAKAAWIAVKSAVLGGLIGALLIAPLYMLDSGRNPVSHGEPLFVLPTIFGALIGWAIGRRKSFSYKLQAQMTLCQMQIELNTHRHA